MPSIKYKYNSFIFIMQLIKRLISFLYSNLPKIAIFFISFFTFQSLTFAGNLTSLDVIGYEDSLEPSFSPTTYEYSIDISIGEIDLYFNYTKENSNDAVTITGNKYIKSNTGVITINVGGTNYLINYNKFDASNIKKSFDYTGSEQEYLIPKTGVYKLETWGAQGGGIPDYSLYGGYGGYSVGLIKLEKNENIYVNVGGKGEDSLSVSSDSLGGYNGGGNSYHWKNNDQYNPAGGGATHIATESGLLSSLENKKDSILIVSGAGGGAYKTVYSGQGLNGSSGGGEKGTDGVCRYTNGEDTCGTGGWQEEGGDYIYRRTDAILPELGTFGRGGNSSPTSNGGGSGGGAGYYGGSGSTTVATGAGGSGYIGNQFLYNKKMVMYSTDDLYISTDYNSKTEITENISDNPLSDYAKIGNGYAKVSYLNVDKDNYLTNIQFEYGILDSEFEPTKLNYRLFVDKYTESTKITKIIKSSENAIVSTINDDIFVDNGEKKYLNISVTSEYGEIKVYSIEINRENFAPGEHSTKIKKL